MEKNIVGFSQLLILIDAVIHEEVKTRALFNGISIKKWVMQAIAEKIVREDRAK
jgi:hypothetical protein